MSKCMTKQKEKDSISFRIPKELDDWVRAKIMSGEFESWSDAAEQALILLRKRLEENKQ